MTVSQEDILQIFRSFLERDERFMDLLMQYGPGFDILSDGGPQSWRFTIPALHGFACLSISRFETCDYKSFRKLLFGSPVNQYLQKFGWQISILENNRKVDLTIYCLEPVQGLLPDRHL